MDSSNRYSLSHPTCIGQIHQSLAEEHVKRGALEMCCSDKVEQVKSSEYFYSMHDVLNDSKDKSLLRPKKFKRLKIAYSKDLEYKKLKTEKNKLKKALVEKLNNDKVESVKKLIIAGAQANRSFSDLFLPVLDKKFADTQLRLETVYDNYRNLYQETTASMQDLSKIFDPNTLSEDQQISIKFLQEKGRLQQWDSLKDEIFQHIEEIWPENATLLYDIYVKTENKRDMLGKFGEIIKRKIENNILEKTKIEDKKLTRNYACQKMCEYIWENMNKITEVKYNTSIIDNFFMGKEEEDLLNQYAKTQIESDIEKLKTILKEQKQHTFARFCQLTENYENFLSHAKIIEKMAEGMEAGSGKIVSYTLGQLLEHSHYSPPDEEIKALDGKTDQASINKRTKLEKINNLLTVKHNHHATHLMGYEAVKHSLTDKSNVVFKVNSLLQLFETKEEVKNLQHAHTFPFPAMFNWKQEKIKEFLADKGKNVGNDFCPEKKLISSQFFKVARESNSSELLDTAFENELEKIKQEVKNNTAEFIYCAIDFLKEYHFRVFSETELLPDFINSEVDQLSEWSSSTDSYKKNIALNLKELIIKNEISKELIIKCLSDHEKNVSAKIDNRIKIWEANETNLNLILQISAIQVKQSRIAGLIATATKVDSVKTG